MKMKRKIRKNTTGLLNPQTSIIPYSYCKNITSNIKLMPYLNNYLKILNLTPHNIPSLKNVSSKFLYWFTGFSEGESTFQIYFVKHKNAVKFSFRITVHIDDKKALEKIQETLGIGTICNVGQTYCVFEVTKLDDILNVLIPIFDYTGLITAKRFDYEIWKEAVNIKAKVPSSSKIVDRRILKPEQLKEINLLKDSMNRKRIHSFFLNGHNSNVIIPLINPYWLVGFVEGEGSFSISGLNNIFSIGQEGYSMSMLIGIQQFINDLPQGLNYNIKNKVKPKGQIKYSLKENYGQLSYTNLDVLYCYLITFFLEINYFQTRKEIDFKLWCVLLLLRKSGIFYLPEGKLLTQLISSSINNRRYSTAISLAPINDLTWNTYQLLVNIILSISPPLDMNSETNYIQLVQNLTRQIRKNRKFAVYVYNENNEEIKDSPFKTYAEASRKLNVGTHIFKQYIDKNKLYLSKYLFSSVPLEINKNKI